MEARAASVRVGLLIVAGIVVILALVWFLRGANVSQGTLIETYFDESVQGLEVGSQVQYRGVTVGRVTALGVVSAEYGSGRDLNEPLLREVYVRYLVDTSRIGRFPSIEDAVTLGLRARLGTRLITGLSYIDLDFVSPQRLSARAIALDPGGAIRPVNPERVRAGAECRRAGAGAARQGRSREAGQFGGRSGDGSAGRAGEWRPA